MKKIITLIAAMMFATMMTRAQVVLVKWTFPTGTASDSIADGGITVNLDKAIHTEGGTSAIDFSKNGASTKAAQATGWNNGNMLKCWVIKVNTTGYDNLKLSSKMQSGGNNPGPKDYMVQYRIGDGGTWTDAPGTTIVTANDWSTGALDSVALPSDCNNQSSLYLRWIMTSNTNSSGGTVAAGGINKIDDINVTGKPAPAGIKEKPAALKFSITPNPSNGNIRIESNEIINAVTVYSTNGKCVYKESSFSTRNVSLKLDSISKGTYLMNIRSISGREASQKLVIM